MLHEVLTVSNCETNNQINSSVHRIPVPHLRGHVGDVVDAVALVLYVDRDRRARPLDLHRGPAGGGRAGHLEAGRRVHLAARQAVARSLGRARLLHTERHRRAWTTSDVFGCDSKWHLRYRFLIADR